MAFCKGQSGPIKGAATIIMGASNTEAGKPSSSAKCQVRFLEDLLKLLHTPEPVMNITQYKLSGLCQQPKHPGTACPVL